MPDDSLCTAGSAPASVLVVDDSRVSASKLAMAMRALGHSVETASGGEEALRKLTEHPFDVVLLDIVMPGMDGYEVLHALKGDAALRDLPIIVISSLDDEIGSVARAIELGAEDFLPKDFEPAILRARLDASLARKRFRDRELDYFRAVRRLTRAAEVIETGAFRPAQLDIDDVAARPDPVGRLAHVFRGLAQEIYARELRFDQTIRTLRGTLLVLAAGAVWGITPALSRIAVGMGTPSLGLAVWVNAVAAIFCLAIAAARGKLPVPKIRHIGFFAAWALIAAVLYRLVTFTVAGHVEASMIALISSLRGFMVFAIAALIALETPSLRRLGGLAVGLAGVAVVLVERGLGAGENGVWTFVTLLLPLLFAVQGILIGLRRPKEIDVFAAVGFMMALSVPMLLPIALATDTMIVPAWPIDRLDLITVTLGIAASLSIALAMSVIALAGPVFASQTAYAQTIAGIVWGVLLLNESLAPSAWAALALMLLGLWMVEPKRVGEEFAVTLRLPQDSTETRPERIPAGRRPR